MIKKLILKHDLLHEIGVIQLKILVELYGAKLVDKMVAVVYRYNGMKKRFLVKKDQFSTRFYRDPKLNNFKTLWEV
jgi:hypothetical protein